MSREAIRVPELSGQAQREGRKERKPPEAGRNPLRHLAETWACICATESVDTRGGFSNSILKRKTLGTVGAPAR